MAAVFHYTQWLPPYISEGKWVSEYTEKFGRYFRRKGWLGEAGVARRDRYWGFGEGGLRIVVEFATAWAVVKALLPARLILSVWATPWFARIAIVPSTNLFKRLLSKRGKGTPVSSAGGTGASAAGVLSESDSKP
ncbi:MAG: hypothetical protein LQ352_001300 [Teloschistes flavicans]|nr:MAG: hypothetical protein LQ352_001300 [Teloschistes flavicans]